MEDGRACPAPLTRIPVNRAELVVAMAKGYRAGRPVWTHGIKCENYFAATLGPTAMLRRVVLTYVQGGEHCRAIRSQVEGKDTSRRIGGRRMSLISTGEISLAHAGEHGSAGRCNEPAKRHQAT